MIGGMFKAVIVFIGIAIGLVVVTMISVVVIGGACCKWAYDEFKRRVA